MDESLYPEGRVLESRSVDADLIRNINERSEQALQSTLGAGRGHANGHGAKKRDRDDQSVAVTEYPSHLMMFVDSDDD